MNTSHYFIEADNGNSHFVFPILPSHIAVRAELQKLHPSSEGNRKTLFPYEAGRLLSSLSSLKTKKKSQSGVSKVEKKEEDAKASPSDSDGKYQRQ